LQPFPAWRQDLGKGILLNWDDIVEDIAPRLYRYFCASFRTAIADELVQDVLLRLVARHQDGRFDERQGSLRMYAFGIAHFVRLEALRRVTHETDLQRGLAEERKDIASSDIGGDDSKELRFAIGRLKEIEKQIVLLHIDEEMTLAEIGQLLDLPLGTVKSHLHRAKVTLRTILGKE
jgi:RNA polymerase sigma-70 factor (ECF subfamily)